MPAKWPRMEHPTFLWSGGVQDLSRARSPERQALRSRARQGKDLHRRGPRPCVLQSVFTTAEYTLIRIGRADAVRRAPRRIHRRDRKADVRDRRGGDREKRYGLRGRRPHGARQRGQGLLLEAGARPVPERRPRAQFMTWCAGSSDAPDGSSRKNSRATSGFEWIWLMYTMTSRSMAASTTAVNRSLIVF